MQLDEKQCGEIEKGMEEVMALLERHLQRGSELPLLRKILETLQMMKVWMTAERGRS